MVLPEQCRTVSEMVDGLPGILGGRISFPFSAASLSSSPYVLDSIMSAQRQTRNHANVPVGIYSAIPYLTMRVP